MSHDDDGHDHGRGDPTEPGQHGDAGHHHHDHHDRDPKDPEPRARALQSLLLERGLVSTDAIDEVVSAYEHEIGPMNGARVVARAWSDASYRERLLEDADAAIAELDFDHGGKPVTVVENTPTVHNVLVCTLCSCYPWHLLGLPPTWYKSAAYRSRMVKEPRAVLAEFGLELPDEVEVHVWDQTAELRYMVLPQRPPHTAGWDEEELVEVVTRDAMVGVDRLVTDVPAGKGRPA